MDITLNEFNTELTVSICTNIQETDFAEHVEGVGRYAERLQLVDFDLSRLPATIDPNDCLVVVIDRGNGPTVDHSHHTREVTPVLAYQQGLALAQLDIRVTLSDVGTTVCELFGVVVP